MDTGTYLASLIDKYAESLLECLSNVINDINLRIGFQFPGHHAGHSHGAYVPMGMELPVFVPAGITLIQSILLIRFRSGAGNILFILEEAAAGSFILGERIPGCPGLCGQSIRIKSGYLISAVILADSIVLGATVNAFGIGSI